MQSEKRGVPGVLLVVKYWRISSQNMPYKMKAIIGLSPRPFKLLIILEEGKAFFRGVLHENPNLLWLLPTVSDVSKCCNGVLRMSLGIL